MAHGRHPRRKGSGCQGDECSLSRRGGAFSAALVARSCWDALFLVSYAPSMSFDLDPDLLALAKPIVSVQPWPRPSCTSCGKGHIEFSSPTEDESHESALAHEDPHWDPEWTNGTFVVRGQCNNPGCQQAVHGTGHYWVGSSETLEDEESGIPYSCMLYAIANLYPPLLIMPIPKTAPDEVREAVLRASRVLFTDPGLAATALRATVERFLTSQGISPTNPSGKFRNAHERIDEWKGKDPTHPAVANLFYAVKWLGNAGTHEDSDLTTAEVLEGADMLNEAFHRLFTGPDIDARAQIINTQKGPLRLP